jgi:hypothetical protein
MDNPSGVGDAFNDYRWWDDLKTDEADLPPSTTVFHYHPIGAILVSDDPGMKHNGKAGFARQKYQAFKLGRHIVFPQRAKVRGQWM